MTEAACIRYQRLQGANLDRLGDIDRTERIRSGYLQHGDRLEEIAVEWDAPPWPEDDSEHSVSAQRSVCETYLEAGATAIGAFDGERLVGIGIVLPHIRPGIAQLAYLYVSDGYRMNGIGGELTERLGRIALRAGAIDMVVSATPSANTVRFYLRRGYEPIAEPLPELFALEPEDVHMRKKL